MSQTEPESSSPLDAFLKQFRKDQEAGCVRTVREYMDQFPGDDDAIGREYFSLKEEKTNVSSSPRSVQTDDRFGPYRIIKGIGQGGQGTVYLAEDTSLHRKVALKILNNIDPESDESVQRFKREAEVASRLDHPGICAIYEAGVHDDVSYIAMRYVEGETVAHKIAAATKFSETGETAPSIYLNETEPTSVSSSTDDSTASSKTSPTHKQITRILHFFEQAARALHEAHQSGIIHRDIKPGNLMISKNGEPVILDFGLARDLESDLPSLTRTGEFFGTPAYMSPEQLMAQRIPLDRRTDVYSLGVTLFESLTLQKPFHAPTRTALYQAIIGDEPLDARRINSAITRDLKVVLETALEKNRDRRYQTAMNLAEDLRRVQDLKPISAKAIGPVGRTTRWAQRRPYRAMSAALLFVIAIAVSWHVAKAPERAANEEKAALREADEQRLKVEGMLQAAFLDLHEDGFADALAAFERALAIEPASVEAIAGKAVALSEMDRNDDARIWLQKHLSAGSESAGLHFVLRWILKRDGRGRGKSQENHPPATPQDHFLIGYLTLSDGWNSDRDRCRLALSHLVQATMMSSPRCLYLVHCARASYQVKDAHVARQCIQALSRLCPDDGYAWYGVGVAHRGLGETAAEAAAFERAIALLPEFMIARSNLSLSLTNLGRHGEAFEQADIVTRFSQQDVFGWFNRGKALRGLGRDEEAIESFRMALAIRPYYQAQFAIGRIRRDQKKNEKAVAAFKKCLEIKSDEYFAWVQIGLVRRDQGKHEEAIAAYRKCLDIKPDYSWAWHGIGLIRRDQEQYEEAIQAFEMCLEIKPDYHFSWNSVGLVRHAQKRYEKAISAFKKCVKIKPDYHNAWNNMAWSLVAPEPEGDPSRWNQSDFANALSWAQEAVALTQGEGTEDLDTLAWALFRNGEIKKAVETEEEAIAILKKRKAPEAELKDYLRSLKEFKAASKQQQQK